MKSKVMVLTKDATVSESGYVEFQYGASVRAPNFIAALPVKKCPPVEQLRRGTRVRLFYQHYGVVDHLEIEG